MSDRDKPVHGSRRAALSAGAAALVGVTLAPGIRLMAVAHARPSGEAASTAVRWGMLIDATRCADGCTACVDACGQENGFRSGIDLRQRPQWIRKVALKENNTGRTASAPMMCQHCAEPPCVDVCPTGASFKRADGIVLVDRHACIGCRYCMMACPYKARSFVHEPVANQKSDVPRGQGTVESCTFCVQRIDRGQSPACVEACAQQGQRAMLFGDLKDSNSAIAQRLRALPSAAVRSDLGLDPGVRYQGIGT
jgi:molybdopterin-containing oxidoreductase family iron-sulfur binding subunit